MQKKSDGKYMNVFRNRGKKKQHFSSTFLRSWRAGEFDSTGDEGHFVRTSIGEMISNRSKHLATLTRREILLKEHKVKVGDRDKSMKVSVNFKFWDRYDEKKREHVYFHSRHWKFNLSMPVVRRLVQFQSHENEKGKSCYNFLTGFNANNEPELDYEALDKFVASLVKNRKELLKELRQIKFEEYSSTKRSYFHTSKSLQREFEKFVKHLDDCLVQSSGLLVFMDCRFASRMQQSDGSYYVRASDIPQAIRQAMVLTTQLVANDLREEYQDGIDPDSFLLRTGEVYRPNSCLATILVWWMYKEDDSKIPKYYQGKDSKKCVLVKERKDHIRETYGVDHRRIGYDLVSRSCGVDFGEDGRSAFPSSSCRDFCSSTRSRSWRWTPTADTSGSTSRPCSTLRRRGRGKRWRPPDRRA